MEYKMDFDIIIYIIIGIFWVVISIVQATRRAANKSQGKPSQNSSPQPFNQKYEGSTKQTTSPKSFTIEDLLSDFMGTNQNQNLPFQYDTVEVAKSQIDSVHSSIETIEEPISTLDTVSQEGESISEKIKKYKHSIEDKEELVENEWHLSTEDLRKAMIYNAILERPKY